MNQAHPLVYLSRHGETALNAQDSFRGPIDAPLNAKGWRQANTLKEYLSSVEFSHAFSSDKIRAVSTANKILEGRDLKNIENHNLRALDVGYLGGQPKNEENLAAIEYYVNNPDITIPDGESLNDFRGRVRPLIADAIQIALDCGIPVLLAVHSSVIHEVGVMLGGHHEYTLVEPGGVACIFIKDGELDAQPIFRPKTPEKQTRGETIT